MTFRGTSAVNGPKKAYAGVAMAKAFSPPKPPKRPPIPPRPRPPSSLPAAQAAQKRLETPLFPRLSLLVH
jgi:hypothetical protein